MGELQAAEVQTAGLLLQASEAARLAAEVEAEAEAEAEAKAEAEAGAEAAEAADELPPAPAAVADAPSAPAANAGQGAGTTFEMKRLVEVNPASSTAAVLTFQYPHHRTLRRNCPPPSPPFRW